MLYWNSKKKEKHKLNFVNWFKNREESWSSKTPWYKVPVPKENSLKLYKIHFFFVYRVELIIIQNSQEIHLLMQTHYNFKRYK